MDRTPARRLTIAALAAVVVALGGWLAVPAPVTAHATLVSSDPADGARTDAEPDAVSLTFNEPVRTPAYLVVESPDGTRLTGGEAEVVDATVSHDVRTSGQAGRYRLAYRVVSADGHPISGTLHYTVTSGRAVRQAADRSDDEGSFLHRHRDHVLWGVGGVLVAGGLLLWPLRRSRA